ncbi:hypothetical protein B0H17DRAFT_1080023 [Mycena rosella]|uniref:MYND-type domain-containing protein n=1 Tax=Mycena rosella TaxID=1033263 RepID=A0AAD7D6X0_MYCRO|nr:hypothetical protein B0H17DRAFT_1080023 [Mycena rosella]
MIALLFTILALALPFVYASYRALKNAPPAVEPTPIPTTKETNLDLTRRMATSKEANLDGMANSQGEEPKSEPWRPPVDATTDITPHERRMLDVTHTASSDHFEYIRQEAKKFEDSVKAGDVAAQKEIRLSVAPTCSFVDCGKPCWNDSKDKWTPKRCLGCLGNYYCSKQCQKADWKPIPGKPKRRSAYHKDWCKRIRDEYMPQLTWFQDQLTQFPWGRLERDGTFSREFLQARFDVLDSDYRNVGFWAAPERVNPHDTTDDPVYNAGIQRFSRRNADVNLGGFAHGQMMLAGEWPSDVDQDGWKLKNEALIPHLFFTGEFPPPARPRPGQVKDWKSWYEWRALPLESPAAVLMDHVLTTYYLLTETLKVVDLHRPSGEQQVVDVHYLGAELELNFLPLFSELALLLPNTRVNLTIFSPATHALSGEAKQRYPLSIAAREGPVWEYTAPRSTGGGSIALSLYHPPPRPSMPRTLRPFTGVWDRSVMMLSRTDPDAIVALNARILSYSTWHEVVTCCAIGNFPFACTDYAQQTVQMTADCIPEWTKDAAQNFSREENAYHELVRERTRPITVNPFHRPGQRPIPMVRSPNLGNGFICKIVGSK